MTVFIEYVFIDNFVIDYMLIKATLMLSGITIKKGRLFFCAFLGGIVAVTYPLLNVTGVLLTIIKILFGVLFVFLSAKFSNKKQLYVSTLIFFGLTFALGGAIIGVYQILNFDYNSQISIATIILPSYLFLKVIVSLVKFAERKKQIDCLVYDCKIYFEDKQFSARGFYDTGNNLYQGDDTVIVANKRFFTTLVKAVKGLPKINKLNYQTVSGYSQMFTIKLQKLEIYIGQDVNIFNNVTLACANESIGAGYDVILHTSHIGGKNCEITSTYTKVM